MSDHLQLPWMASHGTGPKMQGWHQSSCIVRREGSNTHIIAGCFNDTKGDSISKEEGVEIAKANAEFIAKACNSHYSLIEALEKIASGLGTVGNPIDPVLVAKEALASVKRK